MIVAILGAALAASGFAWWHQFQQGRRALDFWGARGATLIRRAPQVELIELDAAGDAINHRDISQTRGLVHARQALISDASYRWEAASSKPPAWKHALRFADGEAQIVVVLDLAAGYVGATGKPATLRLGPTLRNGLQTFFAEQSPP